MSERSSHVSTSDLAAQTPDRADAGEAAAQPTRPQDEAISRDSAVRDDDTVNPADDDVATEVPAASPTGDARDADESSVEERTTAKPASGTFDDGDNAPLLPDDQVERFQKRWRELQVAFVDEPRQAVEQADQLVADLMQRIAASFADERTKLENQWGSGDDVSTEDLRIALTRYRSFFNRLLSA